MSHLDILKKEAELRKEADTLREKLAEELAKTDELVNEFGTEYLNKLAALNQSFMESRDYKLKKLPIPKVTINHNVKTTSYA